MAVLDLSYIDALRGACSDWYDKQERQIENESINPGSDSSELNEALKMQGVHSTHDGLLSELDSAEKAIREGQMGKALAIVMEVRRELKECAPPPPDSD